MRIKNKARKRTGEMGQWVKGLLHKHRDQSPSTHIKSQDRLHLLVTLTWSRRSQEDPKDVLVAGLDELRNSGPAGDSASKSQVEIDKRHPVSTCVFHLYTHTHTESSV